MMPRGDALTLMPTPDCPFGFPTGQLRRWLGEERYAALGRWMRGRTVAECDGRLYDHDAGQYRPSACAGGPHGIVYNPRDVERFVRGLAPLD